MSYLTGTNQNRLNDLLFKKISGIPYTNPASSFTLEQLGSSRDKVYPNEIWSQTIPSTAPTSLGTDTTLTAPANNIGGLTIGASIGTSKVATSYSYITYYDKVQLTNVVPNYSFVYAGTTTGNMLTTNILIGAIPTNYDPVGTYAISVFSSNSVSASAISSNDANYPWTFDGTTGYLTFFNSFPFTPYISFWRYTGTTLSNISTNSVGSVIINSDIQATTFNATSDYRLKYNIQPITKTINLLKPIEYDFSGGTHQMGFLAHEVQNEFPFLVNGEKDGNTMQSINYNGFIALLVKEVQDLKKKVQQLQNKMDILEPK